MVTVAGHSLVSSAPVRPRLVTGLVLSLTDYDRFVAACPRSAQIVLDIIADQARHAAVLQRRFFSLVHSNDPDIEFEPVGAMPVMWNRDEWLDANRHSSA
ncbi:hypothetical protein PV350_35050 [Streptomyces sp. PA03-6a]|nr:hypothetical protein [Streptomyces sp. PA03-6a]MDX2708023.1 hypothetical protein [Streptomyces sp. PA03-6a]